MAAARERYCVAPALAPASLAAALTSTAITTAVVAASIAAAVATAALTATQPTTALPTTVATTAVTPTVATAALTATQIVFNTLMFQLGLLSLLAWRFTDFETVLTGPLIFAAGTLAAFVSAAFTLLCKGIFRWGNTRRRNVRKGSRLRRLGQWMRSAAKAEGGVRVAVMKEWWHYRTSSLRRTPKRALPRMAVVVRQNLSWLLIFIAYFASLALALVFGLSFEGVKYYSVLGGWAVSLGETWLLVEPTVVFIMIILPRFLDEAMTPVSAVSKDQKSGVQMQTCAKSKRRVALFKLTPKKSSVKYVQ